MRHAAARAALAAAIGTAAGRAVSQCPVYEWSSQFGPSGQGLSDAAMAWAIFDDDGPGPRYPALYAGGWFSTAGGVTVNHIARWTGSAWEALGTGISGANVVALAVYDDDGAGPHLPALYAAGDFFTAGGVSATHIARWNGTSWSPVGPGLSGGLIQTLTVFNDGTGEKLFAGGSFAFAGGSPVPRIARWDGVSWAAVPNTFNAEVDVLYPWNGELYAGGMFSSPGNNMARWNTQAWFPMGIGMDGHVTSLAAFDDDGPAGPHPEALYATGYFRHAGGVEVNYIARWDGANWSALNGGVGGTTPPEAPFVRALRAFDAGSGPSLYLGGEFHNAGGVAANSIARWDGATFHPLGEGISGSLPWVYSLGDAYGQLWVGGVFDTAGTSPSQAVARWYCRPCYANCDQSSTPPVLNVADFTCFLQKFAALDPYANCDSPGFCNPPPCFNVADFTCFLQKFAAGCP